MFFPVDESEFKGTRMPNGDRATAELIAHVLRATSSLAFSCGLNPAQWAAMRYFAQAEIESRSVVAFARYHRTTKGTASQTIAALLKKGLLDRRPCDRDRRSASLELTDQGRALLESDPLNELADAAGLLSPNERTVMARGLERILSALSARRAGRDRSGEESADGAAQAAAAE